MHATPRTACASRRIDYSGRARCSQGQSSRRNFKALTEYRLSRHATRLTRLTAEMESWMPVVRRLRPQTAWPEVTAAVNGVLPVGSKRFTEGRLVETSTHCRTIESLGCSGSIICRLRSMLI